MVLGDYVVSNSSGSLEVNVSPWVVTRYASVFSTAGDAAVQAADLLKRANNEAREHDYPDVLFLPSDTVLLILAKRDVLDEDKTVPPGFEISLRNSGEDLTQDDEVVKEPFSWKRFAARLTAVIISWICAYIRVYVLLIFILLLNRTRFRIILRFNCISCVSSKREVHLCERHSEIFAKMRIVCHVVLGLLVHLDGRKLDYPLRVFCLMRKWKYNSRT